jgi:hypothetical protein
MSDEAEVWYARAMDEMLEIVRKGELGPAGVAARLLEASSFEGWQPRAERSTEFSRVFEAPYGARAVERRQNTALNFWQESVVTMVLRRLRGVEGGSLMRRWRRKRGVRRPAFARCGRRFFLVFIMAFVLGALAMLDLLTWAGAVK